MATAHRHRHAEGDELLAEARAALERSGEQWTPMRARVLASLAAFSRPASAYDIAEALGRAEDRRIAPNSVYRILDLFVATNLARRIESANAYVVNAHPACVHDCIFMICDDCARITHIDDDRLAGTVREAARATGFDPRRPVLEVRGRCGACAAE